MYSVQCRSPGPIRVLSRYDNGTDTYDTSEKMRVPAYTGTHSLCSSSHGYAGAAAEVSDCHVPRPHHLQGTRFRRQAVLSRRTAQFGSSTRSGSLSFSLCRVICFAGRQTEPVWPSFVHSVRNFPCIDPER